MMIKVLKKLNLSKMSWLKSIQRKCVIRLMTKLKVSKVTKQGITLAIGVGMGVKAPVTDVKTR